MAASAIKSCANLFREAKAGQSEYEARKAVKREANTAAEICHKVLTGELGPGGPEWAKKAAKSSQPNGQRLERGRLEKVDAVEAAWKVSLHNACQARGPKGGVEDTRLLCRELQFEWPSVHTLAIPDQHRERERPMGDLSRWPCAVVVEWPEHARSAIPTATL